MKTDGVKLRLSNDVRDILAFDQNVFAHKGEYIASGVISLTRRINYMYIYSNIGELVRIGDTEAPLLAVLVYNPKLCQMMSEVVFKNPTYVRVKQHVVNLIEIGIYDETGQVVPFHRDAITSIQLHFRRQSPV